LRTLAFLGKNFRGKSIPDGSQNLHETQREFYTNKPDLSDKYGKDFQDIAFY